MMNGPMPFSGGSSTLKSGTSAPPQVVPFHATSLRVGSHGLPCKSQEARLYSTRRLAGHAQAQFSVLPMPVGVQQPVKIQQPLVVEPSSRNWAKDDSCSPFLTSSLVASLGSNKSLSALPLYSIASSSGVGLSGFE